MVDFYENRLGASLNGLRRATLIDPNEPDYQFHLGQVAARAERYTEAAGAYERFLRVAPRADTDRRARIRGLIDFLLYLGTQDELMRAAGPSRSVVPFELVNNRPVVQVKINNSKETLRFVVDSGAGMCVISTTAAARIGLREVARGGMARAIGGRFDIIYGFLNSFQLGDARVENVPVYIRQFQTAQEPVDGYVGLSLLAKYMTTVDYGSRTMLLLRGDAVPRYDPAQPPPGAEVPIRVTSSGFWSGEIKLEEIEKPVNFIIDTGATISVVSRALAEREAMSRFEQATRIRVYGAAGLTENVQMLALPRVHLGPHEHTNVSAAVLDMDPINETSGFEQTGIVGGNLLRHYRVTFDFPRAVVRLEPLVSAPKEVPTSAAPVVTSQP
jgi:predicted aspartyl protease